MKLPCELSLVVTQTNPPCGWHRVSPPSMFSVMNWYGCGRRTRSCGMCSGLGKCKSLSATLKATPVITTIGSRKVNGSSRELSPHWRHGMTDLDRLDALRERVPSFYDDGEAMHETGDEGCLVDCRTCVYEAEVGIAYPELRAELVRLREENA